MVARRLNRMGNNVVSRVTTGMVISSTVVGILLSAVVVGCGAILASLVQLIGGWDMESTGVFRVFAYLSMAVGGFYAGRKLQRWGWLIGGMVGIIFTLILWWLTGGTQGVTKMTSATIVQLGIGFMVAAFGGMLGVNL